MADVPSTPDGRWMQPKQQTIHKRSRAAEKALSSPSEFMKQIERVSEEKGHSTPRKCQNSASSSLSSASSTGTGFILGSEHFGDVYAASPRLGFEERMLSMYRETAEEGQTNEEQEIEESGDADSQLSVLDELFESAQKAASSRSQKVTASPTPRSHYKRTPQTNSKAVDVFANLGAVGEGSFCCVYKVRRARDHRVFALKRSSNRLSTKKAVHTALNEVRVMRALQRDELHPHIAKFHTHWLSPFYDPQRRGNARRPSSQLHQLYDFYPHGTLRDLTPPNERFNVRQLLQCLAQLLNATAFVHEQHVLHLDLKPSNIFVGDACCLKLGDFGISIDLDAAETNGSTKIEFSGDPIYIAPECIAMDRSLSTVGFAADIFALGIIAFELLFDIRAPSQGPLFKALRNFVDFDTIEAMPQFVALRIANVSDSDGSAAAADVELRVIIGQMLQREAKDRPTAAESLVRVNRVLSDDDFLHTLPELDAIELEEVLSDAESTSLHNSLSPSPATTPSAKRTRTRTPLQRGVSFAPTAAPNKTAPSEFVQSSAQSFEDMAAMNLAATHESHRIKFTPTKSLTPTTRMRRLNVLSPDFANTHTQTATPMKRRQRIGKSASEESSPFATRTLSHPVMETPIEKCSEGNRRRIRTRRLWRDAASNGSPSTSSESAAFGGMLSFGSGESSPASAIGQSALLQMVDDAKKNELAVDADSLNGVPRFPQFSPSQQRESAAHVEGHDDGNNEQDTLESLSQSSRQGRLILPFSFSESPSKRHLFAATLPDDMDCVQKRLSFAGLDDPVDDEKQLQATP